MVCLFILLLNNFLPVNLSIKLYKFSDSSHNTNTNPKKFVFGGIKIYMKATGIVRRIDDLGRVVIPKEIRRTMRIREGDPLEIYTNSEGEVIFKKYSAIGEMTENAGHIADIMNKLAGCPVVIFDRDHVVATSGVSKKEFSERRVSNQLEELMENRGQYYSNNDNSRFVVAEGVDKNGLAVLPIISNGDVTGAVAFMENGTNKVTELQKSLIVASSQFLGKQLEC